MSEPGDLGEESGSKGQQAQALAGVNFSQGQCVCMWSKGEWVCNNTSLVLKRGYRRLLIESREERSDEGDRLVKSS